MADRTQEERDYSYSNVLRRLNVSDSTAEAKSELYTVIQNRINSQIHNKFDTKFEGYTFRQNVNFEHHFNALFDSVREYNCMEP